MTDTTLFTIYRILSKIVLFPDDTKYSRLRTSNPQFQKKIATIDGKAVSFFFFFLNIVLLIIFSTIRCLTNCRYNDTGAMEIFFAVDFQIITEEKSSDLFLTYTSSTSDHEDVPIKDIKLRYCLHVISAMCQLPLVFSSPEL